MYTLLVAIVSGRIIEIFTQSQPDYIHSVTAGLYHKFLDVATAAGLRIEKLARTVKEICNRGMWAQ